MQLDVTEGEKIIKGKVDEAAAYWGGIDVLVNNAGKYFVSVATPGDHLKQDLDFRVSSRREGTNLFTVCMRRTLWILTEISQHYVATQAIRGQLLWTV